MAKDINVARLLEVFDYDSISGTLFWKERKVREHGGFARIDKGWNKRFAGKPVAKRAHRHGHFYVNHLAENIAYHRIVWAIFYKEQPPPVIDHINRDPTDNRVGNLRSATQSDNMANASVRSNNTSGVKGVSWSKKSSAWYAYINKNGKMHNLGLWGSFEDAVARRKEAEKSFFGEYASAE